jgi:two-component system LytT family sensor kinase
MSRRLTSGLFIFAFSSVVGLYFAAEAHLAYPPPLRRAWSNALAVNLAFYWAWGAVVPVVAALTRRFPPGSGVRLWNFGVHMAAASVLTVAGISLTVLVVCPAPTLAILASQIAAHFYSGLPAYSLIVCIVLLIDYQRRLDDRELRSARLQRQLAEARLDVLRRQLNPHFLFNALNSVSSLVYDEPSTADSMIQKIGEFLRLSLDQDRGPEIMLRHELDFVQRYLNIERLRFQNSKM